MVREIEEVEDILDQIRKKVLLVNRIDELDTLLQSWGICEDTIAPIAKIETYKHGKIVVIGNSEVKENILLGIAKEQGYDKSRFEFVLDYDLAQKYNYSKMLNNANYSAIMFGPVPHSAKFKGESESIIAEMEKRADYPPVVRLMAGGNLKITKYSFKQGLNELLTKKIIKTDL